VVVGLFGGGITISPKLGQNGRRRHRVDDVQRRLLSFFLRLLGVFVQLQGFSSGAHVVVTKSCYHCLATLRPGSSSADQAELLLSHASKDSMSVESSVYSCSGWLNDGSCSLNAGPEKGALLIQFRRRKLRYRLAGHSQFFNWLMQRRGKTIIQASSSSNP
jgi:hypothetical protein